MNNAEKLYNELIKTVDQFTEQHPETSVTEVLTSAINFVSYTVVIGSSTNNARIDGTETAHALLDEVMSKQPPL